ncbi:MAG: hypothetical protein ACYDEY_14045 [Acidimicrobiales bacterium]
MPAAPCATGSRTGFNDYTRRVWPEDDLELVTTTYRWWVGDDHRSGWRPPPEPVVRGWRAIYREQWTDQANTLLAYVEAIAADYPRLCRPAAGMAAGQLVREWTLTPEGVTDRHVAKADALADYEARRQPIICASFPYTGAWSLLRRRWSPDQRNTLRMVQCRKAITPSSAQNRASTKTSCKPKPAISLTSSSESDPLVAAPPTLESPSSSAADRDSAH